MPVTPPPLVGRAPVLAEVIRRARAGRGTVLTGPRGSGGSRLVAEAFAALRRSRVPVGRIMLPPVGDGGGGIEPFLPLLDPASSAAPGRDRGAVRSAVLALRLRALVVDDAHLLDAAAGALIVDLARAGTAIVADGTGPGGPPQALLLLIDEQLMAPVELEPLTDDELVDLAEHVLGAPVDAELGHALVTASGGRPGTLAELIDDAVAERSIVDGDGLWRLGRPLPAVPSIRAAVLRGFTTLPRDQRGWIAAVVTAGSIADDLARRIAAPATVAAAEEGQWTLRDPATGCTTISSPRLGAAVSAALDARARVAVLRRLIDATLAVTRPLRDAERVSLLRWRIELGEQTDAEEALRLAQLPRTDRDTREVLLRAAVAGGGGPLASAALAEHLRRTHRAAEALQLIDAVLPAAASEAERVSLVRVRAMAAGVVERRSRDALLALDAHLADFGPHPDLVAVRAGLLLMEGRAEEAVEVAEAVLRQPARTRFATAFALLQASLGLRELGLLERSMATAARFAAVTDLEEVFPQGAALAGWVGAEAAVAVGLELDGAASTARTLHAAVPPEQRATHRPPLAYTLAAVHLQQGDPTTAVRLLREADAGSGGWRYGWQPRILSELTIAQTLAGELDEAAATYDRLARSARPPVQQGRVELAAAQLAAARGDTEGAAALAAAAADRGQRLGLVLDAFDATFAAIRYGAPAAPARLLGLGDRPAGTGRAAQRAYARALVDGDPAGLDRAAYGLWQAGLRLHAIEAAARAADLGAGSAPGRLVAWLARTPGLRLPTLAGRGEGLTAREREVAALAAGGASDRTIADELGISLRTAQTHLARALAKLGVHRRTELRELIAEP